MFLCIDYGSRYIGLAATDYDGRIVYRYGTIDQKQQDAFTALKEIIAKEKISHIVIGIPISLEGNETQQTAVVRAFVKSLQDQLGSGVTIDTIDETLTSVEAAQNIQSEGGKKEDEHAEAARIMLESYLNIRT